MRDVLLMALLFCCSAVLLLSVCVLYYSPLSVYLYVRDVCCSELIYLRGEGGRRLVSLLFHCSLSLSLYLRRRGCHRVEERSRLYTRPDLSYLSVSLSTWQFAVSGRTNLTRIILIFIEFCLSLSLCAWIFLLTRSLFLLCGWST